MTRAALADVKVGDKLIEHRRSGRRDRATEVEVVKVGRKWLTYRTVGYRTEDRCSIETGAINGGGYSSPGTVYTAEGWAAKQRVDGLREALEPYRRKVDVREPWDMPVDAKESFLADILAVCEKHLGEGKA